MKYYLSHSIRGKAGPDASHDVQAKNCAEAIKIADILRGLFPKLELYVPAKHETFIQIAYDLGYLSEKAILDIDCHIIDNCDGVIVYVPEGDELQGGRKVEYDHAVATHKPICVFYTPEAAANYIEGMYRKELL